MIGRGKSRATGTQLAKVSFNQCQHAERGTAVSERLHVDPAGLQVSADRLADQAERLTQIGAAQVLKGKPSLLGARHFATAVEAFAAAYGSRITAHANSLTHAAAEYGGADASGAHGISVSM